MAIGSSIERAIGLAKSGTSQQKMAQALHEVYEGFKNRGFIDPTLPERAKKEVPSNAKFFTKEAKKALGKEGYQVWSLSGIAREEIVKAYGSCEVTFFDGFKGIDETRSVVGEVAFYLDVNEPVDIYTNGAVPLKKQWELVKEFGEKLGKKVPGVKAIIGKPGDYIELNVVYFESTGKRLFPYGAPSVDADFKVVISSQEWEDPDDDIFHNATTGAPNFRIIPLIVPA